MTPVFMYFDFIDGSSNRQIDVFYLDKLYFFFRRRKFESPSVLSSLSLSFPIVEDSEKLRSEIGLVIQFNHSFFFPLLYME